MRDSSVVLIAQPDYVVLLTPIGLHVLIEITMNISVTGVSCTMLQKPRQWFF